MHIPYQDRRSLNAVEQLMADHKWDEIIQLGDFLDFDCISNHNKDQLRLIEGKRLLKDYEEANAVLDRWQKLSKAKITLIEGNHEYRLERYLNANPQLAGLVEVPIALDLDRRGINWVPFWSDQRKTYELGKATFIHGGSTNNFHSKAMAYRYGRNVFYGHTHDIQQFSVETAGSDNTYVGQSLGCVCEYDQSYMRGGPSKWQQSISVFHFFEDGYFTYNVIRIFKHRFYYDGVEYKA